MELGYSLEIYKKAVSNMSHENVRESKIMFHYLCANKTTVFSMINLSRSQMSRDIQFERDASDPKRKFLLVQMKGPVD